MLHNIKHNYKEVQKCYINTVQYMVNKYISQYKKSSLGGISSSHHPVVEYFSDNNMHPYDLFLTPAHLQFY